jgi:hypothetical protein
VSASSCAGSASGCLWSVLFLTVAAPSLAAVVRGLPNDHYHAFADPMVFVLVGLGLAALIREVRAPVGPAVAMALVVALLGWNLTHLPPAVHPDGGFPAGDAVASQVDATLTEQGSIERRPRGSDRSRISSPRKRWSIRWRDSAGATWRTCRRASVPSVVP